MCPQALATHLSACSEELSPTWDWKRAGKRLARVDARMEVSIPLWPQKSQAPPAMPWRPLSQILSFFCPDAPRQPFWSCFPCFSLLKGTLPESVEDTSVHPMGQRPHSHASPKTPDAGWRGLGSHRQASWTRFQENCSTALFLHLKMSANERLVQVTGNKEDT